MSNRFKGKIRRAKRHKLIAAIGLIGPSGSGKTLSALRLAYGMMKAKYPDLSDEEIWAKIGVADTEHERSLIYEGMVFDGLKIGQFQFLPFDPPYDVESYDQAQQALKEMGCEVVILDSISHAWEGTGGLLELQQHYGGDFRSWMKVNPTYKHFIDVVTGVKNRVHTINTMRTKQDYQVERSEVDGKIQIKKVGLKPVMRDSLEYEMQLVFTLDMANVATAAKDNTGGIFQGKPRILSEEDGELIYKWLEEGEDLHAKQEEERQAFIQMIRGLEQEVGEEISKLISSFENHPSVQMAVEDMPLEWLERVHKAVVQKADQVKRKGEDN